MARSIWNGVISFGMVSIPVGLTSATSSKDLSFNQIHEVCGSRVKYQKFCPVCDRVVENEEIVKGYQYSKGNYAILTDEDLETLPVPSKHTIEVLAFVKEQEVDPIQFENAYYLDPDAKGKKPFALLIKALEEKGVCAVAKIALRHKENLCLLRSAAGTIVLETLYYPDEIRKPETTNLDDVKVDEKELQMALSLVDLLSEEFDPSKYHDEYRDALMERIETKIQGGEIQAAPETPETRVYDLMEALKQSVEAAKKDRKSG